MTPSMERFCERMRLAREALNREFVAALEELPDYERAYVLEALDTRRDEIVASADESIDRLLAKATSS